MYTVFDIVDELEKQFSSIIQLEYCDNGDDIVNVVIDEDGYGSRIINTVGQDYGVDYGDDAHERIKLTIHLHTCQDKYSFLNEACRRGFTIVVVKDHYEGR